MEKHEDGRELVVIRVRGSVKVNAKINHTLALMKLNSVNHCILVENKPETVGMIKAVENFVTWGEIDKKTKETLVKKRGKEKEVKPFRLSPPSKGHRSIKSLFPKGACGYRGDKINALLARMI